VRTDAAIKQRHPSAKTLDGASSTSWQLPGGQTLAEFALRSGIVAPSLLIPIRTDRRVAGSSAPGSRGGRS
jgi:hypothetical protein